MSEFVPVDRCPTCDSALADPRSGWCIASPICTDPWHDRRANMKRPACLADVATEQAGTLTGSREEFGQPCALLLGSEDGVESGLPAAEPDLHLAPGEITDLRHRQSGVRGHRCLADVPEGHHLGASVEAVEPPVLVGREAVEGGPVVARHDVLAGAELAHGVGAAHRSIAHLHEAASGQGELPQPLVRGLLGDEGDPLLAVDGERVAADVDLAVSDRCERGVCGAHRGLLSWSRSGSSPTILRNGLRPISVHRGADLGFRARCSGKSPGQDFCLTRNRRPNLRTLRACGQPRFGVAVFGSRDGER